MTPAKVLLYILLGMLLILTVVILEITFSLSVYERRERYNLMEMLGATKNQVRKLILKETLIVSITGSIIGVVLAALILFPFKTLITSSVSIPFLLPKYGTLGILFTITAFTGIISGPVSGGFAVRRIS